MGQLLVALTAVYGATTAALLIAGRQPTVPIQLAAVPAFRVPVA